MPARIDLADESPRIPPKGSTTNFNATKAKGDQRRYDKPSTVTALTQRRNHDASAANAEAQRN